MYMVSFDSMAVSLKGVKSKPLEFE
jgi:hypothetical protein